MTHIFEARNSLDEGVGNVRGSVEKGREGIMRWPRELVTEGGMSHSDVGEELLDL